MDAESQKQVVENLTKMGYTPITIEEQKHPRKAFKLSLFGRVKDEELVLFTRQMYTLIKAGVSLLAGLEAACQQANSERLRSIIEKVKSDVEGGAAFSEALARHPKCFGPLYVSMVKAGEASGRLDDILKRLAEMGEYDIDIKTRVRSATRYPLLALLTLIAAFFVIVTFVIPRFASFFAQFSMELPLPTRVLLGTYRIVHDYWYIGLIFAACLAFGFLKFINTRFGRARWDMVKIKMPIFGPILFKLAMSRFSKTASTLISSGINMLQTLELTADTVGNVIIARAVDDIKQGVNQGKGIAEPMRVSKLFSPIVVQMVSIGEETGKLDELLLHVSEHYDSQVNYAMKNLTTMIEPILIFALASMVLVVALGIFLPMWNMIQIARM
jgi:MSHA biogenesis protein MshG